MVLMRWAGSWVNELLTVGLASASAAVLDLLGADGRAEGAIVRSSWLDFEVIGECTAVHVTALFTCALLAYPHGLKQKALGLAIGIPLIQAINVVRLVSLAWIGHAWPQALDAAHTIVWQSLIVFFALFIWTLWVVAADRGRTTELA